MVQSNTVQLWLETPQLPQRIQCPLSTLGDIVLL